MKTLLLGLLFSSCACIVFAGDVTPFKSQVFVWEKTKVAPTKYGENRYFMKGVVTNHLESLEMHATTLNPGRQAPASDIQTKVEKLVILKEGRIVQTVNGKSVELSTGSVALLMPGDIVGIENKGDKPAVYFMLQWENPGRPSAENPVEKMKSELINWDEVKATETAVGFTRRFFKRPTDNLYEFEMHVTTLNAGANSHPPHVHPDDEIILVKTGLVEQFCDGKSFPLGPGSFVLLNGNDPHGIKNIGKGICEYYAFRFIKNSPVK